MILFICGVLVMMLIRPEHRIEVFGTALLTVVVMAIGWFRSRVLGTPWMGAVAPAH